MAGAASTPRPVGDDPDAARLARYVGAAPSSAEAEDAFAELVGSAGPALYAFVVRFLNRAEDAEDVYQNVWIAVARHAGRFDGRARFATWLYRIARNACVDHLRRRRRRDPEGTAPADAAGPAARDPGPAALAEGRERHARIHAMVATLPEAQREVFLLREEAGLTFEEIGVALGCGRETAKSRMRYALERLRFLLAPEARAEGWR